VRAVYECAVAGIDVKKNVFYVFNVFLFSRRFYLKKRWQSSERQVD